jgi:tripartite-type tricarboxylate transporter receptor subunit TctC
VSSGTAGDYPSRPIRWIAGFPPGGSDDFISIATEIAARANPDGHTVAIIGSVTWASSVTVRRFPGFNVTNTFGVIAPAATPAATVKLLNAEPRNIVRSDDVRAKFAAQGLEAAESTPGEFRSLMEAEVANGPASSRTPASPSITEASWPLRSFVANT